MSNFAAQQGRSVEGRAVLCAVILLSSLIATLWAIKTVTSPAFIITKRDGKQIRARSLQSSKFLENYDDNGFDIQTSSGVKRINYDLRGVRKLEIVNMEKTRSLLSMPRLYLASPSSSPEVQNSENSSEAQNRSSSDRLDEFRVKIRIESYLGEVIEGVSDLKPLMQHTRESLPGSVMVDTNKLSIDTHDIKSIERESSRLYEWSLRLF